VIYRLADEKDLDMLAQMRWLHEYEEGSCSEISKTEFIEPCKEFLQEGLNNGTWAYWVAEENGNIIANVYICRIRKVPKPQKLYAEIGYVTNVHTKAEYRNKGVGTELLKETKQWAAENKIELLFVWPSEKSVKFYERQGFKNDNEIMELEL
jgi:RimJ/RimL family protein N-acetyltransferase